MIIAKRQGSPEATPPARPSGRPENRGRGDRRFFYSGLGALTLLLASVPYLWGWLITPPGQVYTGFSFNVDDTAVYFSWMRQIEDGRFFLRNQFTTEPQRGVLFNLFFWLLGSVVRVTHLPMIAVYQGARVLFGAGLLWAVAVLLREALRDERARRAAFALVCLSAGFGWVWLVRFPPTGNLTQPIDLWQPEAFTFLSLYFSPLFTAALALMAVFMASVLRVERSGRLRDAAPAALAGALLGNFHSYDVIHLFAVWIVFRVVETVRTRRLDRGAWAALILVGLATLPTVAYQYWALRVEAVFYARAFATHTYSPPLRWLLLGYGLVIAFAAMSAVILLLRTRGAEDLKAAFRDGAAIRLLIVWSVVGIAVSHVGVSFERKLLMGVHFPLCALAGALLARLTARLPGSLPGILVAGGVLLTVPTNIAFLARDMGRLTENVGSSSHRPRLTRQEWDALRWLRANARPEEAVLVGPDPTSHARFPYFALQPHLSVYVPALAGNVVYNGHWSETAQYGRKLAEMTRFFRRDTPDTFRQGLLRDNGIRYVLYVNALGTADLRDASGGVAYPAVPWPQSPPHYLRPVYANPEITIYAVAEAP